MVFRLFAKYLCLKFKYLNCTVLPVFPPFMTEMGTYSMELHPFSVFQENEKVHILQLLKALLNETPVNRGELHNGHFEKHSPLLKLEIYKNFSICTEMYLSSWRHWPTGNPGMRRNRTGDQLYEKLPMKLPTPSYSLKPSCVWCRDMSAVGRLVINPGAIPWDTSSLVSWVMERNKERNEMTDHIFLCAFTCAQTYIWL